jgi:hypothetical protein
MDRAKPTTKQESLGGIAMCPRRVLSTGLLVWTNERLKEKPRRMTWSISIKEAAK